MEDSILFETIDGFLGKNHLITDGKIPLVLLYFWKVNEGTVYV